MKIVKEFKEFAIKGNVVDMAVGVVIGTAFAKIVSSFVANVLTPPLGLLAADANFSRLRIILKRAIGDAPAITLDYGLFLQSVFDFTIVAVVIFIVVKGMNSLKRKTPPPQPSIPPRQEVLLEEIRDLLKK